MTLSPWQPRNRSHSFFGMPRSCRTLPHTPPKRLLDKYLVDGRPEPVAKYFAMCEWFDETCGELIRRF